MNPFDLQFFKFGEGNRLWLQSVALVLFCFAVLFGPGFAMFDAFNYDLTAMPDIKTYLGLAGFDFDQSPVRRYRIIVPMLASALNFIISPITSKLKVQTFPGPDFSLCFSFFMVNCFLMSVYGLLVFRLCRAYGVSSVAAVVGVLSAITCRWTSYIVGLPLVDSLYLLVGVAVLLGIKTKNHKMLIACIFIGPWAKESFIFFAPLIFFFSDLGKRKQIVYFALSGCLVFVFRFSFDRYCGAVASEGLRSDFSHFENIAYSLKRLFSFHGAYELSSVPGVWGLLFLFLYQKKIRSRLVVSTSAFILLFLLAVFIHAVLSTELARMFYLASPVLAVWLSIVADQLLSSSVFD